ncbi:hypothetical protein [Roseobacter sp. AzwK-3b]|uniref:hypothetical protein n=1 Tax=Roseobacter sp. AzwK-3b TaxID=351016 RepID=UPI0012F4E27E|nr:hypothetical protein [Roseobacter sp. AzwK-3b]
MRLIVNFRTWLLALLAFTGAVVAETPLDPHLIQALKTGHLRTCLPNVSFQLESAGLASNPQKVANMYCHCLGNFYFNDLSKEEFEEMRISDGALPARIAQNRRAIQEHCATIHLPHFR